MPYIGELACQRKQFRRMNRLHSMVWRWSARDGPPPPSSRPWQWRRWTRRSQTSLCPLSLPIFMLAAADVIWVVNVYQIAMVATLLPLAAFGEVIGHHRIYLGGLLLFTLAAFLCAWAWS